MKQTGEALLAAICADPNDDTSRLVYADWLEEYGGEQDRALAIRLQVRRRSLDDFDPEAWLLDTRLERLRNAHQNEFHYPGPRLFGANIRGWPLVTAASASTPQELLKQQDTIFAAGPISHLDVGVVSYKDKERQPILDAPQLIARCKYLDRLQALQPGGMVPPEVVGVDVLARCPGLSKLKALDLNSCYYQDDLLVHLARCPAWPSLEELNLFQNSFGPPGLQALADAPILASLRSLNLSGSLARAAGLVELLRSPHLTGLHTLGLRRDGLDSHVTKNLAEYPWRCLERLDLSGNQLKAEGIRHLANSERLATLRSLNLWDSDVDDAGVKALAKSPHLGALVDLDLGLGNITAAGVEALARAPWAGQLRRLRLCGFAGGVAGLKALADAPFTSLRSFAMLEAKLTNEGVKTLLAAPWASQLMYLDLSKNRFGAGGAQALAKSAAIENIVELWLRNHKVPEAATAALAERFGERVLFTSRLILS